MAKAVNFKKSEAVLKELLANTYLVYLKTQKFHWNVLGRHFGLFHKFFQELYGELAGAVDEVAERLRTIGGFAPGSFKEFLALTTLKETTDMRLKDSKMLTILGEDHEKICLFLKKSIESVHESGDIGTEDFLIERLRAHEKTLWMIRAHLEEF